MHMMQKITHLTNISGLIIILVAIAKLEVINLIFQVRFMIQALSDQELYNFGTGSTDSWAALNNEMKNANFSNKYTVHSI